MKGEEGDGDGGDVNCKESSEGIDTTAETHKRNRSLGGGGMERGGECYNSMPIHNNFD